MDSENNVTEGPYVLPYEYLFDPDEFMQDQELFLGRYPDKPIYKLDEIKDKLGNFFIINANDDEKLLFAQGAYGVDKGQQPCIAANYKSYLFMMPLSSDNTYPLNDHCVKIDGLSATNEDNKAVNKFITDMTANAYLISFDHVCGENGLGMVEFPIDNYYKNKDLKPIRNKLYLTVYGITLPVNPTDVACEVIEPEPDIFNIPITWTYTEEDTITHFAIERKTESSDFITIAEEIPASERSYTDTRVLSNTTYTYQVLAVNCAGGTGSPVAQA